MKAGVISDAHSTSTTADAHVVWPTEYLGPADKFNSPEGTTKG